MLGVYGLSRIVVNTVALALGSVVLALLAGLGLAVAVAELPNRWQPRTVLVAVFPMLLPPMAGITGWAFVFAPTVGYGNQVLRALTGSEASSGPLNIYTVPAITLVTALYLTPYAFIFLFPAVRGIDPRLLDAARVHGSAGFVTHLRVTVPLIRPALTFATAILLLLGLGQFAAPLLLGRAEGIDVLTTSMFRFAVVFPVDRNAAALLSLPLVLAALALVLAHSRLLAQRTKYQTVASVRTPRASTRRWPAIVVFGYGVIAVVPPVAALVLVSLQPFWSGRISLADVTFRHFEELWSNPTNRAAVWNTIEFSVLGTVVGVVLSAWLGLVIVRGRGVVKRLADLVVNLPLAVPGVVLGMGVLLAYGLGPLGLYGSRVVFVLAFAVIFLPLGVRMVAASLMQVGPQYEAAARTCGAGPLRAAGRILLPLVRPGIAGAAMLLFVMMSHEFAAAQLLATSGTQVMSTQLWGLWENGSYPAVAAVSLVMTAISFAGALLLARLGAIDALGR
ncbi:ABC transporter permease [Actinophytocola sp.]|uniref:ABC transporter permease n=1 Tax=Actinophytocola sp. TaxID=1872138 RepID=UPI003D6AD7EF